MTECMCASPIFYHYSPKLKELFKLAALGDAIAPGSPLFLGEGPLPGNVRFFGLTPLGLRPLLVGVPPTAAMAFDCPARDPKLIPFGMRPLAVLPILAFNISSSSVLISFNAFGGGRRPGGGGGRRFDAVLP